MKDFNIVTNSEMKIDKMSFPKDEIECIINQIIKINDYTKDNIFSEEILITIKILNKALSMLVSPYLVMRSENK